MDWYNYGMTTFIKDDVNLIAEWDFEANSKYNLDPSVLTTGSGKFAYWICTKNSKHRWNARIDSRKVSNCPYCSHIKILPEESCGALYPDLCEQWDSTRNKLTIFDIAPASGKYAYWVCNKGHKWKAIVSSRTRLKAGCPYCKGLKATDDYNFAVLFPNLLKEWDFAINKDIDPYKIRPSSNYLIGWICSKDDEHKWFAKLNDRTKKNGTGCPFCSGRLATKENNLAVKFPHLIEEWDYENNNCTPYDIKSFSNKKIHWICKNNHKWIASVASRIKNKCPYCSGFYATEDNNFAIKFPELLKEWDWEANNSINLNPYQITPHANKMSFWVCKENHKWSSLLFNRTSHGNGCPFCYTSTTRLEKFVEEKLNIIKFDKRIFDDNKYRPDFKLSDNLYLNVDGLYHHCELFSHPNYHFKLREKFHENNLTLLQFYEDEIYNKWSIIESIINNKLGKIDSKFGARDCEIKKVNKQDSFEFYSKNHMMGSFIFAKHFGLYKNNDLISLMSVRLINNEMYIERFCSKLNHVISGAFQRLLKYTISLYNPHQVVSFCDLRYANGRSYKEAGFKLENISQGWCWTDLENRFNRMMCKATIDKTERENANAKKWYKLYDAGQAKFKLTL